MSRRGSTALLLVDFINTFSFPRADRLIRRALPAARATAAVKAREQKKGTRCIYVNDNFGDWTSEFTQLVGKCASMEGPAGEVTRLLRPQKSDLSILKPRHSGFFETPLGFLLDELRVKHLIITGLTTDICIFATAQDAYIRKFDIRVPANCTAGESRHIERQSLEHMARTMKADVNPAR